MRDFRSEEIKDQRVSKLTKITVGTMDLDKDNGQELRAIELHHHPERIKLETKHRLGKKLASITGKNK